MTEKPDCTVDQQQCALCLNPRVNWENPIQPCANNMDKLNRI